MLELTPVESQALAATGYDAEQRVLLIRFRAGATYAYADTPPDLLQRLLSAPSKGRFFQAEIEGRYPYERVG